MTDVLHKHCTVVVGLWQGMIKSFACLITGTCLSNMSVSTMENPDHVALGLGRLKGTWHVGVKLLYLVSSNLAPGTCFEIHIVMHAYDHILYIMYSTILQGHQLHYCVV